MRGVEASDRARIPALACLSLILFAIANAACAATTWNQDAFHLREWGVAHGLPGNHVSAVAQDADGFLWLATMAGLVRFDGVEFRVYNEREGNLPASRFNALDAGPSGRLWIGSEQGHLIVREHGEFRVVAPPHYPDHPVASIAEAGDGSVWFTQGAPHASPPTLFHWTGGAPALRGDIESGLQAYPRAREYTAPDNPGGPLVLDYRFPQLVIARDASNSVWARAWSGSSLRVEDGLSDPFGPGDTTALMFGPASITARGTPDAIELLALEDGSRVGRLARDADRLYGVWLRDRRGLIWVTGINSLEVYGPESTTPLARWPLGTQVLDIDQDREANIWVATRTRGLIRISPNPVAQLGPAQGVPLPSYLEMRADGTSMMALQRPQQGWDGPDAPFAIRLPPDPSKPEDHAPLYELTDRAGTRWRFNGRVPDGTRRDGSRTALQRGVFTLYEDPLQPDTIWAAGDSWYRFRTYPDRDPQIDGDWEMRIHTVPLFDPDGSVWIGSSSGLHHLRGDVLRSYGSDDGLPVNDVRALHRTADRSLWIGTYGGGLVHYDGSRFRSIDHSQGLIEDAVTSIIPDRFGALWLGGNRGIQRVAVRDLQALLDGQAASVPAMLFGSEYGMDNPESTGIYSGLAVGEHLYFSTFGGLVRIDPALVAEREKHAPQVHLLDASGNAPLPSGSLMRLDSTQRDLSLRFTALHLSAPETLRYRHRLEGHEPDWVESGAQREVSYSNLRPGSYRFLLQARHSGGPWVDAGSQPQIEVLPLWWETRAALVFAVLGIIGLLVASWRLGNRQMRQRALALEKLVNERTADLKSERDQVARQATRLQELAEGRARFMSGISHELRTPLSLILAPLTDLGEGRHGALPDEVRTQVIGAHRNAQRLLRLVERLLEVARVEAGVQTLHCQQIDLRAALAELVEQLQPLAQQRGSTLQALLPEQPVPVWIDSLLMESVLVNLMVNGLRHTPPGSCVVVELEAPRLPDTHAIRLAVRDDGPGIPPDALPHLFERFFRVRGEHASGSDGFGLGLPLVREVVERHGGRVEVESTSAGTRFCVQLRAGCAHLSEADLATGTLPPRYQASLLSALGDDAERDEPAADTPPDLDSATDAKLVLVVDDNPELRRLLRSYLQPEFQVQEADNGASALRLVAQTLPDLIITDVMMPVMDGHEFCRALRASPDTDFIPLLMLTAKAGLEHRIEGLEGGADAYLAKPFDRRELMATVHGLFATRQRLRFHYQSLADGETYRADSETAPAAGPSAPPTAASRFGQRLRDVIERHLADEEFDVDALAAAMAQDRSTLYRATKAAFGETPSELLREARLQRAHALLHGDEGSVSEVAYAVGFRNLAHFSTSFRQRFGHPPSQARRSGSGRASADQP